MTTRTYFSPSMRLQVDDYIAGFPKPARIRCPSAQRTIAFAPGVHKFKVKQHAAGAVVEFLDRDGLVICWQNYLPDGHVDPGDRIIVTIPASSFWRIIW